MQTPANEMQTPANEKQIAANESKQMQMLAKAANACKYVANDCKIYMQQMIANFYSVHQAQLINTNAKRGFSSKMDIRYFGSKNRTF